MSIEKIVMGVLLVVAIILALTLHEWAHAAVATLRGDKTSKNLGRLTLNPIPHIDPFMTVLLPAFLWFVVPLLGGPQWMFGGAKPVPVQQSNLKRPQIDMMFVAAAGPAMNLVLAFGALFLFVATGPHGEMGFWRTFLLRFAEFNVLLTVFNLMPIPPLDGSRIVAGLVPPLRPIFDKLEVIGLLLVLGVVFLVPSVGIWLKGIMADLYAWVRELAFAAADRAHLK